MVSTHGHPSPQPYPNTPTRLTTTVPSVGAIAPHLVIDGSKVTQNVSFTTGRNMGKTQALNMVNQFAATFPTFKPAMTFPSDHPPKEADTSEPVQRKLDGVYHRTLWYVPRLDPDYLINQPATVGESAEDVRYPSEEEGTPEERKKVSVPEKANALSSLARSIVPGDEGGTEVHLPCIDIDYPLSFENGLLGIEKPITDDEAGIILQAFKDARLIPADGGVDVEGAETVFGPFACRVLCRPSSTSGHFHLYIDSLLDTGAYMTLLEVMAQAGVVEWGYYEASKVQGRTCLRINPDKHELPWPGEGDDDDMEPF